MTKALKLTHLIFCNKYFTGDAYTVNEGDNLDDAVEDVVRNSNIFEEIHEMRVVQVVEVTRPRRGRYTYEVV